MQVTGGLGFTLALQANGTVTAWGSDDTYGQISGATNLTNVVSIAARVYHGLALLANGTVTNWGEWVSAVGPVVSVTVTNAVNLTNVVGISAGQDHDLALLADGTVYTWGYTSTNELFFTVPTNLPSVQAIASGILHDVVLLTDGTVASWGDETIWNVTNVPPGLSNVVAIAAGDFHTLALKSDGTVVAWGAGTNDTFADYGQSTVPAGLSNVVAVAAGGYSSMALKNDGTVAAWGYIPLPLGSADFQGNVIAIGVGGEEDMIIYPVNAPPVITGQPASQAQLAGSNVTFSVHAPGIGALTYQWQFDGTNIAGATNSSLTLTNVQTAQNGDYQVTVTDAYGSSLSSNAVFAILTPPQLLSSFAPPSNTVWVNAASPLTDRSYIISAVGTDADIGQFPLTYQWQLNGTNIPGATNTSYAVVIGAPVAGGVGTNYNPVMEGTYTLVISNAAGASNYFWNVNEFFPGMLEGWGADDNGQIDRPPGLSPVTGLTAGDDHAAAIMDNGTVVAWGVNDLDQTNVPSGLRNVVSIAAGANFTLALKSDGTVTGWGENTVGQIDVPAGLTNIIAIAAGGNQSLALSNNGTVITWGDEVATLPSGLTNVMAIAAGGSSFLALLTNGTVTAWGAGGDPVVTNLPASLSNVVAVAAGAEHALALTADGNVTAWGDNNYGQTNVPVGLSNVMAIAAGGLNSVALINNGTVVVWGDNSYGQTNVPSLPPPVKLIAAGNGFIMAAAYAMTQYNPIDVTKDLLLIWNTNSADSSNVLNYYLKNRPMVSNANVLGVGFEGFYTTNATVWYPGTYYGTNQTNYGYYTTNATAYESIYAPDFTNYILAPITN